jgi:methionyl-tRNA synthetase
VPAHCEAEEKETEVQIKASCLGLYPEVRAFLDPSRGDIDFHLALARIWDTIRLANQYIDRTAAWELYKKGQAKRLDTVIYVAAESLRFLGVILSPFLPRTAASLLQQLGFENPEQFLHLGSLTGWGQLPAGSRVSRPTPLFPRILEQEEKKATAPSPPAEPTAPASKSGLVSFDTFQSLDLRVGRVLTAERVPKTDKLLKLTVDVGEIRTLVAGIGQSYEPERVVGLYVVVVVNLEPAQIRGILSEGMLLAASAAGRLSLVTLDKPAEPGSRIS